MKDKQENKVKVELFTENDSYIVTVDTSKFDTKDDAVFELLNNRIVKTDEEIFLSTGTIKRARFLEL